MSVCMSRLCKAFVLSCRQCYTWKDRETGLWRGDTPIIDCQ